MSQETLPRTSSLPWLPRLIPDWPLVIWMVVLALLLGLLGGLQADDLIQLFNQGWGRALGEFALILLPSFVLAAALAEQNKRTGSQSAAATMAVVTSPFAAASMVCPDTAYAALSPIAGKQRLPMAFGAYAGFKLIFPAGPLIVATGLGVDDSSVLYLGLVLLIPIWAVAVLWTGLIAPKRSSTTADQALEPGQQAGKLRLLLVFSPFLLLLALLVLGSLWDFSNHALLDFLTRPKGALISAALWALVPLPNNRETNIRRACIDSAVRRTGSLLLLIGAASAFGAILTAVVPLDQWLPAKTGALGIISLFALTMLFKLAQGSSMATFAAVTPVAAPLLALSQLPPEPAIYAICLGSFIAILPNDSYYWLLRQDLEQDTNLSNARITFLLAGGVVVQGLTGLMLLLALWAAGVW